MSNLCSIIEKDKVSGNPVIMAIGPCGLDFGGTHRHNLVDQMAAFLPQFDIAKKYSLPMYFTMRDACE